LYDQFSKAPEFCYVKLRLAVRHKIKDRVRDTVFILSYVLYNAEPAWDACNWIRRALKLALNLVRHSRT